MKSRRVVFRADASHRLGFGHVARCCALIEELAQHAGSEPIAMFGGDHEPLGSWLRDRGIGAELGDWSATQFMHAIDELRISAVVIDGPALADALVPRLIDRGIRVVVIDDLGATTLAAHAVVNHNVHAPSLAATYSGAHRKLLGRRYLMLRREIRKYTRGSCRPMAARRLRVIVTFGGSDPVGATARTLRMLPGERPLELVVVAGPGFNDEEALRDAVASARAIGHVVDLRRSPDDPGGLFVSADAAICSAGGTLGELAYLGCPAIAFAIVPDQYVPARQQARDGLIAGGALWEELTDDALRAQLAAFLADDRGRTALRQHALATADSDGPRRVVDEADLAV